MYPFTLQLPQYSNQIYSSTHTGDLAPVITYAISTLIPSAAPPSVPLSKKARSFYCETRKCKLHCTEHFPVLRQQCNCYKALRMDNSAAHVYLSFFVCLHGQFYLQVTVELIVILRTFITSSAINTKQ